MTFQVYIRRWWRDWRPADRMDGFKPGDLVPNPRARKTVLSYVDTEEQARAICDRYNSTHKPGKYGLQAEYTSRW